MIDRKRLLLFLLEILEKKENFVLLWNGKPDKENFTTYIFTSPVNIISCSRPEKISYTFSKLEKEFKKGNYAAGFISYETGLAFENVFSINHRDNFPLIWFGIYKNPIIFDHKKNKFIGNSNLNHLLEEYTLPQKIKYQIEGIKPNVPREEYIKNINIIKKEIEEGRTYQVNYTFKHKFNWKGNPLNLFYHLCMKQSVSYAAFIRGFGKDILSLSPELFFRRKKDYITVKPMKGTIDRGKNNIEDENNRKNLQSSLKNRAENVMIVDLLRNDLGRISKTGSVKVNKLFEVEKYETLFQMTSTIESKLKSGISWYDIFKNIFPSGSVTGAPKISTMKIINRLEKEPRKVYTGSIGYISPNNESVFNVAIRTVLLDRDTKKGEMGIGSGIVYDSDANGEYDECLLKAKFLTSKYQDFQLIETILWEDGKYFLLDLHLKRLKESSRYFQFYYNKPKIIKTLNMECKKFNPDKKYKVRLLLNKYGKITITSKRLDELDKSKPKITFSDKKTNPNNIFLYHKTTNRKLYDHELKKARKQGFFDVIFTNKKGEITEGCISNIVIKKDGKFYTSPIKCGLLDGVYRQYLMDKKDFPLKEKILFKEDLFNADNIYFINSVRKMLPVNLDKM